MEKISGQLEEDERIWFTYHSIALKSVREALRQNNISNIRTEKSDEDLDCARNCLSKDFSESLKAIILNVFCLEYRINRIMEKFNISNKKITNYIDNEEKETNNPRKDKSFKKLSLYEKSRNIVDVLGFTPNPECVKTILKVRQWIDIRNDIAHCEYKKIQELSITPEKALNCYDDITKAIIEINVAIDYDNRCHADENLKKLLLKI